VGVATARCAWCDAKTDGRAECSFCRRATKRLGGELWDPDAVGELTWDAGLVWPPLWTWAGGGSFVLTGDVPALGLVGATLMAGSFTATPNTPGLAGGDVNALFIALGIDTKDPTLTSFFGLGPDFVFANTEIALGTFTSDPLTGSFFAIPNQADIVNVASVPWPMTGLLLGLGMAGLMLRKQMA
jgi:hypothetical protein